MLISYSLDHTCIIIEGELHLHNFLVSNIHDGRFHPQTSLTNYQKSLSHFSLVSRVIFAYDCQAQSASG